MNKFSTFVTANSFLAFLPLFVKVVWCLSTLLIVKVAKNLECVSANSDHAGEQGGHNRWGVGFPQSYQLYSDFVLEILAFRTCREKKREDLENVCKGDTESVLSDKCTYISPRVRSDPSLFAGVGCR